MKRTKTNTLLREQLLMTQEDFAVYLGISRSLLSLYEKGLRSLPTFALIKLSNLELLYQQMMQKKLTVKTIRTAHRDVQKHDDNVRKAFQLNHKLCGYKMFQLQRQLEDMIDKHNKAKVWEDIMEVMLNDLQQDGQKSKERILMEKQQQHIIKKLVRFGNASQAKLRAQIEVLKAEEQVNKKWFDIV